MTANLLRAIWDLVVASKTDGAARTERMVMLLLYGRRYGAAKPR
jgi:hypothetical protein